MCGCRVSISGSWNGVCLGVVAGCRIAERARLGDDICLCGSSGRVYGCDYRRRNLGGGQRLQCDCRWAVSSRCDHSLGKGCC